MILLQTVLHDLRYAARMLSRNTASTLVMVFALALGIGVNTSVFTAYKAMIARPLDARAASEMVNLALVRDSGVADYSFSYLDYEAYRDAVHSFAGLIACRPARVTLSSAGGMLSQGASVSASGMGRLGLLPSGASNAEFASVFVVSDNYFQVLGVMPRVGRIFESQGDPGAAAVPQVLISENYWQRRFDGDPAIVGKTIHLNGIAVAVAGITPRDFVGTGVGTPAFWIPLSLEPLIQGEEQWLRDRENRRYRLFGRLAPGVHIGQARAEFGSVADHLRTLRDPRSESAGPATALVWPGSPFPLPLQRYGGLQLAILLIMAAAALVLAVACANVGSLQLARARSRQHELHTRLSLGAGRLRIIRQLVTESVLPGLLAGILALFVTSALLKVGVSQVANALPVEYGSLVFDVTPDLQIFFYVFALSFTAGMLSGLVPALESSRSALSSGVRAGTSSVRSRRLQDLLIAGQVALSLMLMITGSLFIRSSLKALRMDTGYDGKHVVAIELQYPPAAKYTSARKLALVQDLRTRFAALPGVAAVSSAHPPGSRRFRTAAAALDGTGSHPHAQALLDYTYVQANYFHTLGIPLLSGRGFQPQGGRPEQAVILSESVARQLWPGRNPIGRSLRLGPVDERFHPHTELHPTGGAYQVIGVARDKRGREFDGSDSAEIYLPLSEDQLPNRPILIRTRLAPAQVMRAMDVLIASVNVDVVATLSTLEAMLRQSPPFIISGLAAAIASTLGSFGLLLALMGIYSTVSYVVVLRTREVGIRMAIGAQKRDVLSLILRESARPVITGLFAGILLALITSYLLRGLLYGVQGVDGVSFAGVSLFVLTIALLASYSPARRAMRVDPMIALRYE